ncbi:MAG: pilus assembly protein PilM [bacterium]|nr:pilus assembly protein PilM [bacterium]
MSAFETFFRRHVPPPKFLTMPATGIDVSDHKIRFIKFTEKGNHRKIKYFGEMSVPAGAISDGYINDRETVKKLLVELKEKENVNYVNVSFPEEKAFLFKTQIPKTAGEDISTAVEFRIEENVPISAGDCVFDYMVDESRENHSHVDVGVSVLPKKTVETYISVFKEAGLRPKLFTIEAQAITNAVIPKDEKTAVVVVNLKEDKTGIYIIRDKIVHFTSTVAIGGDAITKALGKNLSISQEEAKRLKDESSFNRDGKNTEMFSSLVDTVSALKDEVGKVLTYWKTHVETHGDGDGNLSKIILCGRDAGIDGFPEYLASALNANVSVGEVWENAFDPSEYVPPISFFDSLDYAAAIGVALEG